MSPLKWNSKSTYQISEHLTRTGHAVSEDTVQRRLRQMGYSLQANKKDKEGESHVDRDRQFRYINETAKRFLKAREPVISVDTKKKEKVGNFKNSGRKWHKKGPPRRSTSTISRVLGKARRFPTAPTMCIGTKDWSMWE